MRMLGPTLLRVGVAASLLSLLLGGLYAGLLRMGWQLPVPPTSLAALHGPLLVCGVLGAVICLERAVALGYTWGYVSPLLALGGGLALLTGLPIWLAALLMLSASGGLLAIFAALLRRQPARYMLTMALGAGAWLGGNLLWLGGWPFATIALWWASFLVLTIVGERLELGRLRELPAQALWIYSAAVGAVLGGILLAPAALDLGMRLAGLGWSIVGLWLLHYDLARRTIRRPGLPRFSAVCILSGSVWLVIGGLIALGAGAVYSGFVYDALLHSVFVGFVFAMIFGHAPIIAPALLKLPLAFRRWNYAPLALLHASLVLRLTSDVMQQMTLRRWAGLLNAASIVTYLLLVIAPVLWAGAQQRITAHAGAPDLRGPQS